MTRVKNRRARRWLSRSGAVAIVWALLALVTGWLGMRPNLLALVAVAVAASSVLWFIADTSDVLTETTFRDESATRKRPITHGRLGLLRRLSEDATRRTDSGHAPPGALSFQQALQTIAERALAGRLGRPPSRQERDVRLGPELTAYLADPDPPALSVARQQSFIDRIEAL